MELYPPLLHPPLTLERTTDLGFMTDVKHELLQRFRESPFYHPKQGKRDTFEPIFERLPSELNWKKTLIDRKLAKKRKIDDEIVRKRLEKLSQREKEPQIDDATSDKEESDKEDDDAKKANEEDLEGSLFPMKTIWKRTMIMCRTTLTMGMLTLKVRMTIWTKAMIELVNNAEESVLEFSMLIVQCC
uniref:Uncharacterized protein n=1 Tax=Ditylenchus dipsaci TaxID=166011 RepID=A0A915CUL4_9BILA